MSTTRLETFADGVFAIAATLLILNVVASPVASVAVFAPIALCYVIESSIFGGAATKSA